VIRNCRYDREMVSPPPWKDLAVIVCGLFLVTVTHSKYSVLGELSNLFCRDAPPLVAKSKDFFRKVFSL
jgi:hypothetical protein